MFTRLKRTVASLVAVLAAFWVYRLVAEPLIEPRVEEKRVAPVSEAERRAAFTRQSQNRLGNYLRFFPEGSWELDDPIVLESDRSKLLLKKYDNLPDGRVKLTPCTVIYLPEGEADEVDSRRRVIILQMPQGAELKFDEPVDISRGKFGRLVGGEMPGPITIHSGPTRPEGGDDLLITTRDARMVDNRLVTPHEVDFRFGPSYGHGRELRIDMLPAPESKGKRRGPSVGGVQSIQLVRDVEMHLQPGSSGFVPGDRAADGISRNVPQPPVDIRCQGPLVFDMLKNVVRFNDNVRAVRPNPTGNGPSDQLTCDLLSVFFASRASPPARGPSTGAPRLEPRRIVAEGNVVLRAPSTQREVQAQHLEYELAANGGTLGSMQSIGPGWLTAAVPNDISRRFEARWSRELKMRPQDENHVVSIVGDAHASVNGEGEIVAGDWSRNTTTDRGVASEVVPGAIHVWFFEVPPQQRPAAGERNHQRVDIRPVKMLAEGKVHIESPQLSGNTGRLETNFSMPAASGAIAASANPGDRSLIRPQRRGQSERRYEIRHADLIQVGFLMAARPTVEHLTLQGDVAFAESPSQESTAKPLEMSGDQVQVRDANTASETAKVFGRPAQISAEGMTMRGATMQFDRAAKRVWIEGEGRMTLISDGTSSESDRQPPIAGGPQNDPFAPGGGNLFGNSSEPSTTVVDFQGGMVFDGKTARFERDVVATQIQGERTQTLRTQVMEATLREAIDFATAGVQLRRSQRPSIELMRCRGEVWLENREVHDGSPTEIDRMLNVSDLAINRTTGELTGTVKGDQPGRFLSWRLGTETDSMLPGGRPPANRPAAKPGEPERMQINFLEVQFQRGISGSLERLRQEVTFSDRVRSIYGPVATWETQLDVDNPQGPGPDCTLITCDELEVRQLGPRVGKVSPIELEARKNARIEGRQENGDAYTALAHHVTYDRLKDLLSLYGEGNNHAQLFVQPRSSPPQRPTVLREIHYRPSTHSFQGGLVSGGANWIDPSPPRTPRK